MGCPASSYALLVGAAVAVPDVQECPVGLAGVRYVQAPTGAHSSQDAAGPTGAAGARCHRQVVELGGDALTGCRSRPPAPDVESVTVPTVVPLMVAVMVEPLNLSARLCQRPVPSAATVPLARVRTLPLVLLLIIDHDPVGVTRR